MNRFLMGMTAGAAGVMLLGQGAPLRVPSPAEGGPLGTAQPVELELQLGKTVYPVRVNQPFNVTTPKGERVQAVVRRRDVLRYSGTGVTFSYPRQLKLNATRDESSRTLELEGHGSILALVQVFTVPTTPAAVRKQYSDSFRREFKSRGGKFTVKTIHHRIAGAARTGELFEWALGGERIRSEIYTFQIGQGTVAVLLQRSADEEVPAKRYFAILADSLRATKVEAED